MKISKSLEKLAVDANPILSAIIGGSARDIFLQAEGLSFYTTVFNFKEVEKYIPVFSEKKDIPAEDLYFSLSILQLFICDEDFYKENLNEARRLIGKRDPCDVPLLALALKLECPIWSNDKDFDSLGIAIYSTLDLIKFFSP